MRNAVDDNRVLIFDTTLRDGEQAPGFSMGVSEKLRVAAALRDMGVDIIEAGFAAASPGDEEAINAVAREIEGAVICSLARASIGDIEAAARALEPARERRLHIFLATSPIHREAKLNMTHDQVVEAAVQSIKYARTIFDDVEFSAEDAIRTEPDFLVEVLQAAADAGATTLNVPDTVGYSTPDEIGRLFAMLKANIKVAPGVRFSTHCHNDLGMAVANSVMAVKAGARQIECTINGIGERAGNSALEEVVMALRTRADLFEVRTGIDTTKLTAVSRLVSRVTKSPVVRNKAVVGRNSFAHEAGIHQHGVMSDARTYEVMRPEDVGMKASELVLGKHSGRHAVDKRARELGYQFDSAAMMRIFASFKRRADEIGALDDDELHALFTDGDIAERGWSLTRLEARTDKTGRSRAVSAVELARDNESTTHVAIGETALEAAFLALREAAGEDAHVVEIDVMLTGYGATPDATAETTVNIGGRAWAGHGQGPDPLWAGVRAFLDAFNKAGRAKGYAAAPRENYNEAAG